jgi:hypothetical protein
MSKNITSTPVFALSAWNRARSGAASTYTSVA